MRGFTLIELMIVIAILSIVAGIGYVKYNDFYQEDKLYKALYKIKYDLAYLQNKKMRDTKNYKIIFNTSTNSYACFLDANDNGIVDTNEVLEDTLSRVKEGMQYSFYIAASDTPATNQIFEKIELESIKYIDNAGTLTVATSLLMFVDRFGGINRYNAPNWDQNIIEITLKNGNLSKTMMIYPLTMDVKID